jgi:hypothetical protein
MPIILATALYVNVGMVRVTDIFKGTEVLKFLLKEVVAKA